MDYINGDTRTKRFSPACLDDDDNDCGRLISYNVDPGVGTWVLRGAHKLVGVFEAFPLFSIFLIITPQFLSLVIQSTIVLHI